MKSESHRRFLQFPVLVCAGCSILPFVAVHGAFVVSASHGFVDWCNPYWDSCTSISATGRHPPASYVFRGLMLPIAMLLLVYWWLQSVLLEKFSVARSRRVSMLGCGILASIGLALYVTVLGEIGDVWRTQRRIGAILFFSLTFLAQLLLAGGLCAVAGEESQAVRSAGHRILRLCQIMLLVGLVSVGVQLFDENMHDNIEDAIEWQLALLLQLNFAFSVSLWWQDVWQLRYETNAGVRESD
ncbi:MAG: hypothetical protein AAGC91_01240 [Pseudomonadota bacterium]